MKQLIFLLIPISLFSQKGLQDTIQYPVDPLEEKYNMIYYSSSLIKKENKSIWYYASYDLMYGEEVGSEDYFKKYDNRADLGNTQPGDGNTFF